MGALTGQTIAASYEQILHVDADGGGNTTTPVNIKDGDNGTTFALRISTEGVIIDNTGGTAGDTYCHFAMSGTNKYVMGIDNSVTNDPFKIHSGTAFQTAQNKLAAITIESDGSVSIGDPAENDNYWFHVHSDDVNEVAMFESDDATAIVRIADGDTGDAMKWQAVGDVMSFWTDNTQWLTILANGDVGMGVASPSYHLDIQGSGAQAARIKSSDNHATLRITSGDAGDDSYIYFDNATDAGEGRIYYSHDATSDDQKLAFNTGDSHGTENAVMWGSGRTGFNKSGDPLGQVHINGKNASSLPVIRLEQLDVDQAFIRFECASTAADASECVSTSTSTAASIIRQVRVQYPGSGFGWIRIYDDVS